MRNFRTDHTILLGKVVDIEDPEKLGRIKCEILDRTVGIDKEDLPWYHDFCRNKDTHDLPKLNDYVEIILINDDIHIGYWMNLSFEERFELSDDDYKSAKILIRKWLEDWEDEGLLQIQYTKTDGLLLQLKNSKINIRRNGTIHLFSETLGKQIDISDSQISLGSEGKSLEPAVMGKKNNECHTKQADYVKWLAEDVLAPGLQKLSTTASGNPYTAPLGPIFQEISSKISSGSPGKHDDITSFLPELLSELVSLDKSK